MRRIGRLPLSAPVAKKLRREQANANTKNAAGTLKVEAEWKRARQTQPLKAVVAVLKDMAGPRERCMFCGNSHGTDIEHFWPKARYPEHLFQWTNMLLGCTDCGRIKGSKFPLAAAEPLMVDPTVDDPWYFLDFDPDTGNLVPRFHEAAGGTTLKGEKTVEVLQLDRREALARGYQMSFRRIRSKIEEMLPSAAPDAAALVQELTEEEDDHRLLGWCFRGAGVNSSPLIDLRQRHPAVWAACVQALGHF
ncbi:MAG: hypothetical protein M3463_11605 [Verrucomicrobiota bacterium]|nr:hypothetical protein [Verrucomicrobiota bacterium]